MVILLQNKNRTDRPKTPVKTSKETLDQCDFAFFISLTQFYFPNIFSGNKNELCQKNIRQIIVYAFFHFNFFNSYYFLLYFCA